MTTDPTPYSKKLALPPDFDRPRPGGGDHGDVRMAPVIPAIAGSGIPAPDGVA